MPNTTSPNRLTVTIILPTYNEAENIIPLIAAVQRYVPKNTDILVVDDNSPDGTAAQVKTNARIHLLVRTNNRGLTNSLTDGINATQSDIVAWMDCDFSHPPEVLPKLLDAVTNGSDIAIAGRIHYSGLSRIINRIAMLFFGNHITDYTTGFLAAKKSVLTRIPLRGDYGEYCIDLLVRAKTAGFRITEIPYDSPPRMHGHSKTTLTYGYGYIRAVLRLLWTSGR